MHHLIDTGTWSASTAVAGFHGTNYLHHFADADPVGTRVVDNPQGSASGTWAASTAVVTDRRNRATDDRHI